MDQDNLVDLLVLSPTVMTEIYRALELAPSRVCATRDLILIDNVERIKLIGQEQWVSIPPSVEVLFYHESNDDDIVGRHIFISDSGTLASLPVCAIICELFGMHHLAVELATEQPDITAMAEIDYLYALWPNINNPNTKAPGRTFVVSLQEPCLSDVSIH